MNNKAIIAVFIVSAAMFTAGVVGLSGEVKMTTLLPLTPINVWQAGFVGACLLLLRQSIRVDFYRAYFREKQIGQGKDPDAVVRREFPVLWRILR